VRAIRDTLRFQLLRSCSFRPLHVCVRSIALPLQLGNGYDHAVFLKYFDHGKNARGLAGVGETQHRTFELGRVGPGRAKFIQVREKDVRRLKADLISSFRGAPPSLPESVPLGRVLAVQLEGHVGASRHRRPSAWASALISCMPSNLPLGEGKGVALLFDRLHTAHGSLVCKLWQGPAVSVGEGRPQIRRRGGRRVR